MRADAAQRSVQIDGAAVHVAGSGASAPGAAPLLLLHGNPDTHTVWDAVVERLAPRHLCIAPDLPGFGRSAAPTGADLSLEAQGRFVLNLVDALDLPRAHLVIHDVGGVIGLAFATMHPERVSALTILNTNFFPDYRWHFWARVWRTPLLGELSMAIANGPLFVREMRRGSPRIPREYAEEAWAAFRRPTRKVVLRWYRAMDPEVLEGWDARMLAATAALPRQVLWGDLDPFLPARTADRFGGEVRHFPDAGHWVMLEEPDAVAAAIDRLAGAPAR